MVLTENEEDEILSRIMQEIRHEEAIDWPEANED